MEERCESWYSGLIKIFAGAHVTAEIIFSSAVYKMFPIMFKTLKHVYYVFHKTVLTLKLAVALQENDVEIVKDKRIFLAANNFFICSD